MKADRTLGIANVIIVAAALAIVAWTVYQLQPSDSASNASLQAKPSEISVKPKQPTSRKALSSPPGLVHRNVSSQPASMAGSKRQDPADFPPSLDFAQKPDNAGETAQRTFSNRPSSAAPTGTFKPGVASGHKGEATSAITIGSAPPAKETSGGDLSRTKPRPARRVPPRPPSSDADRLGL